MAETNIPRSWIGQDVIVDAYARSTRITDMGRTYAAGVAVELFPGTLDEVTDLGVVVSEPETGRQRLITWNAVLHIVPAS